MSKSFKFNSDNRYDLVSKKTKADKKQAGRLEKQLLKNLGA